MTAPTPPDEPRRNWLPGSDPRERPADPAGTQPKVEPGSLLPTRREPLLLPGGPASESADDERVEALDEELGFVVSDDEERIPDRLVPAPPANYVREGPEIPPSRYAPRFQFITGVLLAIGAAALAAVIILVVGGPQHDDGAPAKGAPDWSQWQPSTGGVSQGAAEIGLHVAPLYRTAAGRQLVEVSGGAMSIAGVPLVTAVRQAQSAGGKISFDDDKGALYQLCGPLSGCKLPGTPSTERGALLQREALELALYSFRYLDGVQQVAVLLPPGAGTSPAHALWFRRDAMDQQLSEPLEATLLPKVPTTTNVRTSPDASLVGELTSQSIFDVSVTRNAQGDNAFLVLDPPTGPATTAAQATGTKAGRTGTKTTPGAFP